MKTDKKQADSSANGGTRAVVSDESVVAGVADPGSENGATETAVNSESFREQAGSGYNLPNSRKIYLAGKQHADLRVPFFVMSSGVETSLTSSLII
jgi:hypothetical protein